MTIAEMHVWFRQYAQQMGLQNVRAILPEQIDLIINTSITDIINQIITQNIGITNDRIITDNSKIGQINALRSLYKVALIDCRSFDYDDNSFISRYYLNLNEDRSKQVVEYYDMPTAQGGSPRRVYKNTSTPATTYNSKEDFEEAVKNLENKGQRVRVRYDLKFTALDYLYIVDTSIDYVSDAIKTNYYPIRIIDDAYLADTLNDFVLKPRRRSPIGVIYNNQLDLYISEKSEPSNGLQNNNLRFSYIAKPAKVAYLVDLGGTNVDCDLPEYLHVDILKHAVDLYRIAVSGQLHNSQQQAQPQQQAQAQQQP
jgi:hypothetical protein